MELVSFFFPFMAKRGMVMVWYGMVSVIWFTSSNGHSLRFTVMAWHGISFCGRGVAWCGVAWRDVDLAWSTYWILR